jgi:uncharacterized protein (TIGR02231 family)
MKTLLLAGCSMLISLASLAQITQKEVKSEITEVKVFLIGSELKRTGKVNLNPGTTKLLFPHLSTKIEKESIQANFGDNVKIVNVESSLQVVRSGRKDTLRIAGFRDSILVYQKKMRKIKSQLATYEGEMETIESNKIIKNSEGGTTVAELEKLSDFYRKRLGEINQRIFEYNEELTNYSEKIRMMTDSVSAGLKYKENKWTDITITVHTSRALTADYELKYLTGGSGWSPTYDIRVKDVLSQIDMEYKAKVINQTEEDWNNVKLSFSSAMPTESQEAPDLEPWLLNFDNRKDYEGKLNEFRPNTINKAEALKRSGNISLPEGVEFAEVELSLVDFEFKTEGEYTIPSTGNSFMVSITNYNLPVTFKYVAIPKVDKAAFLVAEVTGWESLNLIEGPTNIYFRGTFMGKSYLKPQYANDTLNISLGRDNKVIINRVKVEDAKGEKLIGTNKWEEFNYKISVRNTNPGNIKFTLYDQVPVAQDDDIKVEILDISNAEQDPYSGRLKWKFDLASKQANEFSVHFAVKYPKNKELKIRSSRGTSKSRYGSVRFL